MIPDVFFPSMIRGPRFAGMVNGPPGGWGSRDIVVPAPGDAQPGNARRRPTAPLSGSAGRCGSGRPPGGRRGTRGRP
jgi:hypothetical protein